jgi:transcriptional regulator with XRE-family HTH domain
MKNVVEDAGQLGRVVRSVRVQAGLTQADAAALCGVSAPFLNALERGKPTARLAGVLAVCRGLGIQISAETHLSAEELENAPARKRRASRK